MKGRNIFWGLFFVAAAALLIVNQLGLFINVGIFSILLTIILAAIFIKSLWELSWVGIFFPLAFAAIIYSDQLGLEEITPWYVLIAALLLSIGASFLFGSHRHSHHHYSHTEYTTKGPKFHDSESFSKTTENLEGQSIYSRTRFSGSTKYIKSDNFKEASIDCSFGQADVYFDEAKIINDSAQIVVNVSFGECNLYLPKEWRIENRIHTSFGDTKEKNFNKSEGLPVVTLTGSVSFGDCNIIYV